MLDPSVFKAYDVRGVYPTELDEDGAYRVARAYTEHFEPRSVAVGHDIGRVVLLAVLVVRADDVVDALGLAEASGDVGDRRLELR